MQSALKRDDALACSNRAAPRCEPLRSRPPLVQITTARTFTPLNARLHADARQSACQTAAPLGRRCIGLFW